MLLSYNYLLVSCGRDDIAIDIYEVSWLQCTMLDCGQDVTTLIL